MRQGNSSWSGKAGGRRWAEWTVGGQSGPSVARKRRPSPSSNQPGPPDQEEGLMVERARPGFWAPGPLSKWCQLPGQATGALATHVDALVSKKGAQQTAGQSSLDFFVLLPLGSVLQLSAHTCPGAAKGALLAAGSPTASHPPWPKSGFETVSCGIWPAQASSTDSLRDQKPQGQLLTSHRWAGAGRFSASAHRRREGGKGEPDRGWVQGPAVPMLGRIAHTESRRWVPPSPAKGA